MKLVYWFIISEVFVFIETKQGTGQKKIGRDEKNVFETTMVINRSSIYNTYGNKNELFFKALEQYTGVQKGIMYKDFIKDKSPLAAIGLLFESPAKETLSDKKQKGCFLVNTTTGLANQDPGLHQFRIKAKKTMVSIFTELIVKAQAEGEVPVEKDAHAIALYFFSFLQGLRVTGMLPVRKKELQQIAEFFLYILNDAGVALPLSSKN